MSTHRDGAFALSVPTRTGALLMIRSYFVAIACIATTIAVAPASAQFGHGNSPNNLFSQYTTLNGSTTAGMYPAPHPAPLMGAQSYYTYQPLMPHEMMYTHNRNYYNYYNTGGYMGANNALNKTTVRWQSGYNHMAPLPFSTGLSKLHWNFNNRRYCIDGNCGGGGAVRGHFRGGHLRGGLGCASGNCEETYDAGFSEDVYGGEEVMGESGGCASCTAAAQSTGLNR